MTCLRAIHDQTLSAGQHRRPTSRVRRKPPCCQWCQRADLVSSGTDVLNDRRVQARSLRSHPGCDGRMDDDAARSGSIPASRRERLRAHGWSTSGFARRESPRSRRGADGNRLASVLLADRAVAASNTRVIRGRPRLYMLEYSGDIVLVEISDIDAVPGNADEYSNVIDESTSMLDAPATRRQAISAPRPSHRRDATGAATIPL